MNKKAFSLMEALVVLVVIGVVFGGLFRFFISNWFAYEDKITRADLWHEANEIVETMTHDGRMAKTIEATEDATIKSVEMRDVTDNIIAVYSITQDGTMQMDREGDGDTIKVLSRNLDFDESEFVQDGISQALTVTLHLRTELFLRNVLIDTSTEIFPRNINF